MDKKTERQFEWFFVVKRRKTVSKTSTFSISGRTTVSSSASTVERSVSRTIGAPCYRKNPFVWYNKIK